MKPVSGSKGSGVYRVDGPAELDEIIDEYSQKRVRVAVVEEAIEMPDYRIVTLDGELISAYQRKPLAVTGNGVQTVSDLIDKAQVKYIAEGRDTKINKFDYRIEKQLGLIGLSLNDVIDKGVTVAVAPVSNLSMGGTSEDVTTTINPRWAQLAADIAHNFNLRLCGLDLACEDVTQESSAHSVLEVNSSPGLDHFASSGQAQSKIVDELYTRVINAFPNIQTN